MLPTSLDPDIMDLSVAMSSHSRIEEWKSSLHRKSTWHCSTVKWTKKLRRLIPLMANMGLRKCDNALRDSTIVLLLWHSLLLYWHNTCEHASYSVYPAHDTDINTYIVSFCLKQNGCVSTLAHLVGHQGSKLHEMISEICASKCLRSCWSCYHLE